MIFVKISECYQISLKNLPYLKDFMACLYRLVLKYNSIRRIKKNKKISNDQELIQSHPISCPQNQKGNN